MARMHSAAICDTMVLTPAAESGLVSIPWNLTTNAGAPVHSGIYFCRARVTCDESEEATRTLKLIINRTF